MGEAYFTPGPWKWAGRKGGWDGVDALGGENICHLEYNNPLNARLIAAAPDLYAALTAFLAAGADAWPEAALREAEGLARAALAKANGEPQA